MIATSDRLSRGYIVGGVMQQVTLLALTNESPS